MKEVLADWQGCCQSNSDMLTQETVRGQQMIERIRELERTGFVVTRMKCESENGVYTISFSEDWSKRPVATPAPAQSELSL